MSVPVSPPAICSSSHEPVGLSRLSLLLGLEVLVGKVSSSTADQDNSINTDAQTGGVASRRGGTNGTRLGSLGGWVAGLEEEETILACIVRCHSLTKSGKMISPAQENPAQQEQIEWEDGRAYLSLQVADE